jgi:hypothetical protein
MCSSLNWRNIPISLIKHLPGVLSVMARFRQLSSFRAYNYISRQVHTKLVTMDALTYNRELDEQLSNRGIVDATLYAKLTEACAYDTATSVGWVAAKLHILAERLKRGDQLSLFEPAQQQVVPITSDREFATWAKRHFPVARYER